MTDEILKWIQREKLIQEGDRVIAGVSGGADSVCLLLLLLKFQEKTDFSLRVVHVEHGIRGDESEKDARFVEAFCEKYGVPCHVYYRNVPEYAAQEGVGLEEAARILRYECYRSEVRSIREEDAAACGEGALTTRGSGTAAACGEDALTARERGTAAVRVALAHHADDNAETILFQMIRGSGLKGLCGMQPQRAFAENATIIRPLLQVSRREIEQYLEDAGQTFRNDSTNWDMDYSRNRIRHKVMPELAQINDRSVFHMTRSAGMLREISDYLDMQVQQILPAVCSQDRDACRIAEELFLQYPVILQREVVFYVLGQVAGSCKDIGSVHVEAVLELAGLQVGRSITLPYQMKAKRVYGGIWVFREKEKKQEKTAQIFEISPAMLRRAEQGEILVIPLPDGKIELKIFDFSGKMEEISKKKYTKWLNYDKIKCGLQIRKRAGGDYLVIDENGHKKKLKEYFISEKIPGDDRNAIWLLAEASPLAGHIIWVVGGRISADYKIAKNTQKILEVHITGGTYHED